MQEIDSINRTLSMIRKNMLDVNLRTKDVNVIINSVTGISIDNVRANDLIVLNITNVGTTASVGSATIIVKVNDVIQLEQSIAYRDITSVTSLVFKSTIAGECKVSIEPTDELIPIKVDKLQVYIFNNIEGR